MHVKECRFCEKTKVLWCRVCQISAQISSVLADISGSVDVRQVEPFVPGTKYFSEQIFCTISVNSLQFFCRDFAYFPSRARAIRVVWVGPFRCTIGERWPVPTPKPPSAVLNTRKIVFHFSE